MGTVCSPIGAKGDPLQRIVVLDSQHGAKPIFGEPNHGPCFKVIDTTTTGDLSVKEPVSLQTTHCHPAIHTRTPLLIRQRKFGQSSISYSREQIYHRSPLFNSIQRALCVISEGVSKHPLLR